jgi:hypothetical protein
MLSGKIPLLLLLLIGLSFAQYIDFMPLVPMVGITMAVVIAFLYMAATAFSNPRLLAWVKTELRELIAGVILVSVIFSSFVASNSISMALSGDESYMESAIVEIEEILTDDAQGVDRAYKDIIVSASKVRAGATYMPNLSIPLWYVILNYSTSPYSGIAPMLSSLGMGASALSNIIFIYEGLLLILKFSAVVVPSIILPLAFCARLIPFTRKIGNTLIGLSLGVMVIMPLSIILVGSINHDIVDYPRASLTSSQLDELDANPWAMVFAEPFCGSDTMRTLFGLTDVGFAAVVCLPLLIFYPPGYPACLNIVQYSVYPIISNVFYIVHAVILGIWIGWAEIGAAANDGLYGWAKDVFGILYPFLVEVNNLTLLLYVDFILIALLTVTGAKSISSALGGEWYLAGIQRLV